MFVRFTEALAEGHVNSVSPLSLEKRKVLCSWYKHWSNLSTGLLDRRREMERAWAWGVKKPVLNRRKEIADGSGGEHGMGVKCKREKQEIP